MTERINQLNLSKQAQVILCQIHQLPIIYLNIGQNVLLKDRAICKQCATFNQSLISILTIQEQIIDWTKQETIIIEKEKQKFNEQINQVQQRFNEFQQSCSRLITQISEQIRSYENKFLQILNQQYQLDNLLNKMTSIQKFELSTFQEIATYLSEKRIIKGKIELNQEYGWYNNIKKTYYSHIQKLLDQVVSYNITFDNLIQNQTQIKYQVDVNSQQNNQSRPKKMKILQELDEPPLITKIKIYVYDSYNNSPIKDAEIAYKEESNNQTTPYITDENGICEIVVYGVMKGSIDISSPNYFPIIQELVNYNVNQEIYFPLINKPLSNDNSVYIQAQTNLQNLPIEIQILTPDNVEIPQQQQIYNEENGYHKIEIDNVNQKRGVFRIIANIIEPELVSPQTLKLYFITKNELRLIDIPKNYNNLKKWDIGIICAPNPVFLEINTLTNLNITKNMYLQNYKSFLEFLQKQRNLNLNIKTLFGFQSMGFFEIKDDLYIFSQKIHNQLSEQGFNDNNLDYFIYSAMQLNGMISLKKLESKFSNLNFEFIF